MHPSPDRSHPTLFALGLALCLALAACSARGMGGSPSSGDDGGTSTGTLSFNCTQLCAPLASEPTCMGAGVSTCESTCNGSLAATPAACVASANALYACTRTASPRCTTMSQFPFANCQAQYGAYVACVASPRDAGAATPDAGTTGPTDTGSGPDECADATDCGACTRRSSCGWCAGRCWRGGSSGPTGGSCGGTAWAWTSSQCSAGPADAGFTITPACQSCAISSCPAQASACSGDNMCLQCVGAPGPACLGNPAFGALAQCACASCAETCGSLCRSL
jgi:hypothetical protein